MNISMHAKERYAERIMDYDDKTSVQSFIAQHEEKITKDLNKMKEYGQLLYSGKSLKGEKSIVDIYLKDTWVLLVDKDKDNLITVYKVDLKVDEDFNKEYIAKILSKLEEAKEVYNTVSKGVEEQEITYRNLIQDNELSIAEYRKTIKSLESQNESYKDLLITLNTNKKVADDKVREVITILTGNKTW